MLTAHANPTKTILHWLPWFWSLGGNLQTEDGQITLSTPAAATAMQWYRDLAHRYRVTPPTFYSMDQDTVFQGMASGLFAITEGGSWEIAMLAKHSPHSDKIRIALLPRPRLDGSSTTLIDGWGFGILTQGRQKQSVLARLLGDSSGLLAVLFQLAIEFRLLMSLSVFGLLNDRLGLGLRVG